MKKRIVNIISTLANSCLIFSFLVFFGFPASTNYKLKSFEFGGGGGSISGGSNSLEGVLGEVAGRQTGATYNANSGLVFVQQANTPAAPTFQNNNNWYNKLHFVIATSSNPSDTTYAIAISTNSNFIPLNYIQGDDTIGANPVYQTYANWGGASGEDVLGLSNATTYYIKVTAKQGNFTASPFGPSVSQTTSNVTLSFDIDIGGSSDPGETADPYQISLGALSPGSVTTGSNEIWLDFDTNAIFGGYVYIYDQYGGLRSSSAAYTITSTSGNLTSQTEGFGLQGDSKTQGSGGPMIFVAPYNGTGETVGLIDGNVREIVSSSNSPVTSGRISLLLKAKASNISPSSSDYTDILTVIAAGNF